MLDLLNGRDNFFKKVTTVDLFKPFFDFYMLFLVEIIGMIPQENILELKTKQVSKL